MFYSLTQQAIRQNIVYWTVYVCLKPDHCQQFIFYFYYVKYVVSGDFTFFQHINMNIPMYLKNNHEANIIQNGISLNDEMENDCTKIVPEFHEHVKKWWSKICVRDKTINESVHDIKKM